MSKRLRTVVTIKEFSLNGLKHIFCCYQVITRCGLPKSMMTDDMDYRHWKSLYLV